MSSVAMNEIIPRLWISGERTASNYNLLNKSKITHVVTLTGHTPFPEIEYLRFDIQDSLLTNIIDTCLITSDWIHTKLANHRHNILVHCGAGVSRSGAIIIAYLILKCGFNYSKAYTNAISRRHQITPNANFVFQLKYLDYLFNKDSIDWHIPPYISTTYKMTEFTTLYILFHTDLLHKYKNINIYTSVINLELPTSPANFNIIPITDLRFVTLLEFIKPVNTTELTLQVGHNESIALYLLYNHLIINGYRKATDALNELSVPLQELQLLQTYYDTKITPGEQLLVKLHELSKTATTEMLEEFETYNIPTVVIKKKLILQSSYSTSRC